jgi:hypothetical protein
VGDDKKNTSPSPLKKEKEAALQINPFFCTHGEI